MSKLACLEVTENMFQTGKLEDVKLRYLEPEQLSEEEYKDFFALEIATVLFNTDQTSGELKCVHRVVEGGSTVAFTTDVTENCRVEYQSKEEDGALNANGEDLVTTLAEASVKQLLAVLGNDIVGKELDIFDPKDLLGNISYLGLNDQAVSLEDPIGKNRKGPSVVRRITFALLKDIDVDKLELIRGKLEEIYEAENYPTEPVSEKDVAKGNKAVGMIKVNYGELLSKMNYLHELSNLTRGLSTKSKMEQISVGVITGIVRSIGVSLGNILSWVDIKAACDKKIEEHNARVKATKEAEEAEEKAKQEASEQEVSEEAPVEDTGSEDEEPKE